MPAAPSPSKVCARRFARLRRSRNSPRAPHPKRRPSTPTFPFRRPSPRARALWRRSPIFRTRAWMSWRACAASLPVPLIPTPPKRHWSPRWCRTTIRCSLTALAGRSSSAFAADRSPTWSRTSTAWPMPTCAAARSPMARSSRLSIHLRPLTKHRQSCSTLLRRQLPISMTSQARVRRRTTLPAAVLLPSVSCRCPSIASYMCWTCCAARPSPLSPPGRGG